MNTELFPLQIREASSEFDASFICLTASHSGGLTPEIAARFQPGAERAPTQSSVRNSF